MMGPQVVENEKFCLRWNDYGKMYAETFRTLREDDQFADVTLACEGHTEKGHRIILCACSGYFSHILRTIPPSEHPVLLLSDVKPTELTTLMDFIYYGQINITQDSLQSFLKIAVKLQIKGFCERTLIKPEQAARPVVKKNVLSLTKALQSSADDRLAAAEPKAQITLTQEASIMDLMRIMKQQTHSDDDRWKVLDARDKYIRLKYPEKQLRSGLEKEDMYLIGTCPDICPEKERYGRSAKNQLHWYEKKDGKLNHLAAVKEHSRSAADQNVPLPHELRPASVLNKTMNFLMCNIVDRVDNMTGTMSDWFNFISQLSLSVVQPTDPWAQFNVADGEGSDNTVGNWYVYMWNVTRAIRKDITQQNLTDLVALSIVEKCARFHIFCSERLCEEKAHNFDWKLNDENLIKCLRTLKHMYHDLQMSGDFCPQESEFRAYDVLMNLNKGDILREIQTLSEEIQKNPQVLFALKCFKALNSNNYVLFFNLVKKATYLEACILKRYFYQVRKKAVQTIITAYVPPKQVIHFPVETIVTWLAFESDSDCMKFLRLHGIESEDDVVFLKRRAFVEVDKVPAMSRSKLLIDSKKTVSLGEIVNGGPLPNNPYLDYTPHDSFDSKGYLKLESYEALDQKVKLSPQELEMLEAIRRKKELAAEFLEDISAEVCTEECQIICQAALMNVMNKENSVILLGALETEFIEDLISSVATEVLGEMEKEKSEYEKNETVASHTEVSYSINKELMFKALNEDDTVNETSFSPFCELPNNERDEEMLTESCEMEKEEQDNDDYSLPQEDILLNKDRDCPELRCDNTNLSEGSSSSSTLRKKVKAISEDDVQDQDQVCIEEARTICQPALKDVRNIREMRNDFLKGNLLEDEKAEKDAELFSKIIDGCVETLDRDICQDERNAEPLAENVTECQSSCTGATEDTGDIISAAPHRHHLYQSQYRSSTTLASCSVARVASPVPVTAHVEDEEEVEGYNSEDEYRYVGESLTEEQWRNKDLWFESVMRKKGYIIKKMGEDGACLFRAVADQVYGEEEMHQVVRTQCLNYLEKNSVFFSQFVTQNFDKYVRRKRRNNEYGNHLEIQALAEMFSRPIHIYSYSSEPINIIQNIHQSESDISIPIRLCYQRGDHYNSLVVPNNASIGENKLRATDCETTDSVVVEQVAREQWFSDQEITRKAGSGRHPPAATVTSGTVSPSLSPSLSLRDSSSPKAGSSYQTDSPKSSSSRSEHGLEQEFHLKESSYSYQTDTPKPSSSRSEYGLGPEFHLRETAATPTDLITLTRARDNPVLSSEIADLGEGSSSRRPQRMRVKPARMQEMDDAAVLGPTRTGRRNKESDRIRRGKKRTREERESSRSNKHDEETSYEIEEEVLSKRISRRSRNNHQSGGDEKSDEETMRNSTLERETTKKGKNSRKKSRIFKCPGKCKGVCKYQTDSFEKLRSHMYAVFVKDKFRKKYPEIELKNSTPCPVCTKKCQTTTALMIHMRDNNKNHKLLNENENNLWYSGSYENAYENMMQDGSADPEDEEVPDHPDDF